MSFAQLPFSFFYRLICAIFGSKTCTFVQLYRKLYVCPLCCFLIINTFALEFRKI